MIFFVPEVNTIHFPMMLAFPLFYLSTELNPIYTFFFKTNTNSTFSFQSWIVAVLEYFIQEEKKNNSLNRVKLVSHSQLKAQYVGHDLLFWYESVR